MGMRGSLPKAILNIARHISLSHRDDLEECIPDFPIYRLRFPFLILAKGVDPECKDVHDCINDPTNSLTNAASVAGERSVPRELVLYHAVAVPVILHPELVTGPTTSISTMLHCIAHLIPASSKALILPDTGLSFRFVGTVS